VGELPEAGVDAVDRVTPSDAASTVRRDAVTAARACGAIATRTPWRATATTSAMDRE